MSAMDRHYLDFHLGPVQFLDSLARGKSQQSGGGTEWFGAVRSGLIGFSSRIIGVQLHYKQLHSWRRLPPHKTDNTHIADFFFNCDSALECFVYALNGLGNAVDPSAFIDLTDDKALTRIRPGNVLGDKPKSRKNPRPGYDKYFPSFSIYWRKKKSLIRRIMDYHDVTKHRHHFIFTGGIMQMEAPPGFYESLGMSGDDERKPSYWPFEWALYTLHTRPNTMVWPPLLATQGKSNGHTRNHVPHRGRRYLR